MQDIINIYMKHWNLTKEEALEVLQKLGYNYCPWVTDIGYNEA